MRTAIQIVINSCFDDCVELLFFSFFVFNVSYMNLKWFIACLNACWRLRRVCQRVLFSMIFSRVLVHGYNLAIYCLLCSPSFKMVCAHLQWNITSCDYFRHRPVGALFCIDSESFSSCQLSRGWFTIIFMQFLFYKNFSLFHLCYSCVKGDFT